MDERPTAERLDEILDVLSDRHRRLLVYYLMSEKRADREELVSYLRDRERARSGSRFDPSERSLSTDIHHTHLPKLRDAGLIEANENGELRFRAPAFLDVLLPVIRTIEPGVEGDRGTSSR